MARETACGEWFDTHELTAAQPTLPFGTRFARDKRRYRKIRDGSGNPVCCVAAVALKARHRCSGPARTSCSAGIGIHCFVIDQRRRLFGVWFDLVVWHYLLPIDNVRRLFRTRSRFIPTAHQLLSSSESISAFPPRSGCGASFKASLRIEVLSFSHCQFLPLCRRQITSTDHLDRIRRILALVVIASGTPALFFVLRRIFAATTAITEHLDDDDRSPIVVA
jgi:hypothetical protein